MPTLVFGTTLGGWYDLGVPVSQRRKLQCRQSRSALQRGAVLPDLNPGSLTRKLCSQPRYKLHSRAENCCVHCALENVEHLHFPKGRTLVGLREKEEAY